MPKEKRDERKRRLYQDKISLNPLRFGEAVADMLKVKPELKVDKKTEQKKKEE